MNIWLRILKIRLMIWKIFKMRKWWVVYEMSIYLSE